MSDSARLLRAAVEGMGDAAAHRQLAQRLRDSDPYVVDGLRRDVTHAQTGGAAGEPAVGDEQDVLAYAGALDRASDGEHLPHARAAARAAFADGFVEDFPDGYEQVIGERWKPFERAAETTGPTVDRKAAAAQMAAFGYEPVMAFGGIGYQNILMRVR